MMQQNGAACALDPYASAVSICPVQKGGCAVMRGNFRDGFPSTVRAHAQSVR